MNSMLIVFSSSICNTFYTISALHIHIGEPCICILPFILKSTVNRSYDTFSWIFFFIFWFNPTHVKSLHVNQSKTRLIHVFSFHIVFLIEKVKTIDAYKDLEKSRRKGNLFTQVSHSIVSRKLAVNLFSDHWPLKISGIKNETVLIFDKSNRKSLKKNLSMNIVNWINDFGFG